MADEPVLSVRNLTVDFDLPSGPIRVIDGVSFDVYPNEALCIVGESGSGKSVTMLSVMGLLPPNGRIVHGQILFQGRSLRELDEEEKRKLRGGELSMIFQDPLTSLNPVIKVGPQISEMIRLHQRGLSRREIRKKVVDLLGQVEMPRPELRYSSYPHEFSGGMRQRAMIAMAVANTPALLVADEPTTALDVTIQAQVLDVLRQMRKSHGAALILITHDLGVVAESADRVVVMYCGRVMETGTVGQIFNDPRHPYTAGLMASLLRIDTDTESLVVIRGQPPAPANRPSGCPFHPRCNLSRDRAKCSDVIPLLRTGQGSHAAACHFADETPDWIAQEMPQIHQPVEVIP